MTKAPPNPSGLCMCGCGLTTPVCDHTDNRSGAVRGEHLRFVHGHNFRRYPQAYEVDDNGCWVWQGSLNRQGYGWTYGDVERAAHRAFYRRHKGPIPDGLELDHLCRNRLCVNPGHLEAVTHAENAQRGAKAKLTAEAVIELRRQYANRSGTHTAFAREKAVELGVAWQTVDGVLRGYGWTNLEEDDDEEFDRAV